MSFGETWADADPEGNNDNPPPEGIVDAALMDAAAFTSKAGDDFVKFEWQSVDKQYEWTQMGGFKSSRAAGFTKGQCMKIGVDVDSVGSLDELDTALKTFVGGFYELEVKHNDGFVNTYINDGQAPPDVPADTENLQPVAAGGDDDVPF